MAEKKTKALTFDQIAAAPDMEERHFVEVPEWGGGIYLRRLTRGEVLEIRKLDDSVSDAAALSYAAVEPTLTVEQAQAILDQRSFQGVLRVLEKVIELAGAGPDAARFREGASD